MGKFSLVKHLSYHAINGEAANGFMQAEGQVQPVRCSYNVLML